MIQHKYFQSLNILKLKRDYTRRAYICTYVDKFYDHQSLRSFIHKKICYIVYDYRICSAIIIPSTTLLLVLLGQVNHGSKFYILFCAFIDSFFFFFRFTLKSSFTWRHIDILSFIAIQENLIINLSLSLYIYIYIYVCVCVSVSMSLCMCVDKILTEIISLEKKRTINKWVECSPMARETKIQSQAKSYRRLKNVTWYLLE